MDEWIVRMEVNVQNRRRANAHLTAQITGNGRPFYRVPAHVREAGDRSIYLPRKISIGPYHYGTPSYEQGERGKEKCLINFLSRTDVPLQAYIDSLADIVDELRNMYDGLNVDPMLKEDKKEAFLQMMVLDGCYLLEIMLEELETRGDGEPRPGAVFNPNEMDTYRQDMLLLDNQIPIKVLRRIYEKLANSGPQIKELMATILKPWIHSNRQEKEPIFLELLTHVFFSLWVGERVEPETESSSHLLAVYRRGFLGGETYSGSGQVLESTVSSCFNVFPSATQLEEAKIGIKPILSGPQISMSFHKRTLELKQIVVDGPTCSNFYNMIFYERLHPVKNKHISSYIRFMGALLKDAADSRLLRARGILNTTLRDEQVIGLFGGMLKNISFRDDKPMDDKIWEVALKVKKGYKKNSQSWRKDLFQKYLRSPWAVISVFVAFLILTFTAFQTVYTILGYYKQ